MHIRKESAVARRLQKAALLALFGTLSFLAASPEVLAQSASGSIYGQASPGATVTIKNQGTGLTREEKVADDGTFTFPELPTGMYTVTRSDKPAASSTARVNAGVGTSVNFSENLEEVVILGTSVSPIDTKTAQVSTTFSSTQLSELPITPSVLNVALLAPGVARGTTGANGRATPGSEDYGQAASFGGASIAENQYYINGFNVTNLFRNLQYADLPFSAIDSQQVVTGGYGPEYGLSTGGVVNIQTKKGTGEWKGGVAVTYEPNSLRALDGPVSYMSNGLPYNDSTHNESSSNVYDVWAGGPLVPGKLFMYAVAEYTKNQSIVYPNAYFGGNIWDQEETKPFGLVKLDWNINDSNIVEFTGIKNNTKNTTREFSSSNDANGFVVKNSLSGTDVNKRGGWIATAKYTSYITDDLTASVEYGQLSSDRASTQYAPDGSLISYDGTVGNFNQPGCPWVVYAGSWEGTNPGAAEPSCYVSTTIDAATGVDKRKAGRFDLEYRVPGSFLGRHTLKAGYSKDDWTSFDGTSYAGGVQYRYAGPGTIFGGSADSTDVTTDYVRVRHFQTGANAGVNSKAYYFKDDWQVTKDVLVQLGVRNDSFYNMNGAGDTYLTQDNIWQPRLGVAWDMNGDSSKKLYGSWGLYSLPVTAGVSIRGASSSIFCYNYYAYTAIDPTTGAPTLGNKIVNIPDKCFNGETGAVPLAGTFAATDLKPTQQSEFIVGYQEELSRGWKAGLRVTFRELLKTVDDYCDNLGFDNWAARTGWTHGTAGVDASPPCLVTNPGYSNTVKADVDGNGTADTVVLTQADTLMPKAVRKYLGAEFTLEKVFSHRWYTQLSYTWAHNFGNAEGLADSDLSQLDIGTTEAFDFPELMYGASGNLPNDHRHTFKGLAVFKPTDQWIVSGNFGVQTGKPISCIGAAPFDRQGYGAAFHYCNGAIVSRGSVGTTDTVFNIDLSLSYLPRQVEGLSLQASVFNVFNGHAVTNVDEFYTDGDYVPQPSYLANYSYQSPRYMQLRAQYQFNFAGH